MTASQKTRHILWTGGWDSTYRILDVLYNSADSIQPYYLIYLGRHSTEMELKVINRMMDRLSDFGDRLKNPIIRLADRYKYANEPYIGALKKAMETKRLGTQYLCLAQFRDEAGRPDMELCAEKDGGAWNYTQGHMLPNEDGLLAVAPTAPEEMKILFGGFLYPLYDWTKLDMQDRAQTSGFLDVLEEAWFCHTPQDGEPCGVCPPCQSTIHMGLGRRVGENGLKRYHALESKLYE